MMDINDPAHYCQKPITELIPKDWANFIVDMQELQWHALLYRQTNPRFIDRDSLMRLIKIYQIMDNKIRAATGKTMYLRPNDVEGLEDFLK